MITKLDFVAIPSRDPERSRRFYADTLGLRRDERAESEFWAGETCLTIWEPARLGMEFAPQKNGHLALHVDDVSEARAELEAKGIEFVGETFDTGVCHMAFFTDPDGNDLMLRPPVRPSQLTPGSDQADDLQPADPLGRRNLDRVADRVVEQGPGDRGLGGQLARARSASVAPTIVQV